MIRARRGQAMTELVVLMLVLLPIIIYTLFLEDLLFYKLDQGETVFGAAWDFHVFDYQRGKSFEGQVARYTGRTFWDHTSAANSYSNPNVDAKGEVHHQALTAHQCWLTTGAQQLQCHIEAGVGLVDQTQAQYNQGGLAVCSARLGVQNYYVLNQLFVGQWQGKVELTRSKKFQDNKSRASGVTSNDPQGGQQSDGIHANARTGTVKDHYVYPKETFGVLHDPWALNEVVASDPTGGATGQGEFGARVQKFYDTFAKDGVEAADQYRQNAFLDDVAGQDGNVGDNVKTAPLAWDPSPSKQYGGQHLPNGWGHWKQAGTGNDRQGYKSMYMGMPASTW